MGQLSDLALATQSIGGAAGLAGSISEAGAQRAQGAYGQQVANQNADFALMEAVDAEKRGGKAATRLLTSAGRLKSSQLASYAGQGVDVSQGSPAEVMAGTDTMAADDTQTLLNNAYREGWGHRVEAMNYRAGGRMSALAGRNQANQTLLTGGLNFSRDMLGGAMLYDKYQQKGGGYGLGTEDMSDVKDFKFGQD